MIDGRSEGITDGNDDGVPGDAVGLIMILDVTFLSTGSGACPRSIIAWSVSFLVMPQRSLTLSFRESRKAFRLKSRPSTSTEAPHKRNRTATFLILSSVLSIPPTKRFSLDDPERLVPNLKLL